MEPLRATLSTSLISETYLEQGVQSIGQRLARIKTLLSQRRLPAEPWDDLSLRLLLDHLAAMDSNNFAANAGVGEREGRVFSALVRERHYGMAHGIGRSGDIAEQQPKAAGSSLMYKLCNLLAADALRVAGLAEITTALVLPTATGMALALALRSLRTDRPAGARFVVWPRIDQKTCLKAIVTAGLTPLVIENTLEGDECRTDVTAVRRAIEEHGPDAIACVVSTTSCFAPRAPERVIDLAKICREFGIPHLVNNAYGVQCPAACLDVTRAMRRGRVDLVVQSTDKNFMVPVGGSVVASADAARVAAVSKMYPGRASASPILDLFITLLSMGRTQFRQLIDERVALLPYFSAELAKVASKHGERMLNTDSNGISFGITLSAYQARGGNPTFLGSMLFARSCSGTRVVAPGTEKTVAGVAFNDYGSHRDGYPTPYLTAACAMGITRRDIDVFCERLDRALSKEPRKS